MAFNLLVGWLYQGRIPAIAPPFGGFKTPEVDTTVKEPLVPGTILQLESTDGTRYRRLLGPATVDVWMGMGSPPAPPKNEGTSQVAYHAYTEHSIPYSQGGGQTLNPLDLFISISAQKEYRKWSPEELRAADYSASRKWNAHLSADLLADISELADGALDDTDPAGFEDSPAAALQKLSASAPAPFTHTGHIPGIPHSVPLSTLTAAEEQHQLGLLSLCLLAETLCWDALFNRAMSAYLLGEAALAHRPLPAAHVSLIYSRAHASSPARAFAADSAASHLRDPAAQRVYADLARHYPPFLADVFASLGRNPALRLRDPTRRGACAYHVHVVEGEGCAASCLDDELRRGSAGGLFGRVEPAHHQQEGGSLFELGQHTRAWMDWREMTALLYRGIEDWEW